MLIRVELRGDAEEAMRWLEERAARGVSRTEIVSQAILDACLNAQAKAHAVLDEIEGPIVGAEAKHRREDGENRFRAEDAAPTKGEAETRVREKRRCPYCMRLGSHHTDCDHQEIVLDG